MGSVLDIKHKMAFADIVICKLKKTVVPHAGCVLVGWEGITEVDYWKSSR